MSTARAAVLFLGLQLFQLGSPPHPLACKNLRMFAKAVLPELKRS